jgi:nitrite reductase (NAD(P)H)
MKKAGRTLNTSLCPHFSMSRTDLFNVIKVKQLRTLPEVMEAVGVDKDSIGCETCKPAIGSILSSL